MFPFDSPSKTGSNLTSGVLGVRLPYLGGRDQGWCTWYARKFENYDQKVKRLRLLNQVLTLILMVTSVFNDYAGIVS